MSLTPISPEVEPVASTSIQLSFSSGKGGAWDDRELINAANAAMKEFHTHHPGPGSWLDKATAAKAAGRPLPGGDDYGTAWYSASSASASTSQPQPQPPSKKRKTQKSKPVITSSNIPNPYATTSNTPAQGRATSPTYAPTSPRAAGAGSGVQVGHDEEGFYDANGNGEGYEEEDPNWGQEDEEDEDEDDGWDIEDYTYPQGEQTSTANASGAAAAVGAGSGVGPSLSVQPSSNVSRDDALGYAMTAQYWAGYWMGIAQARGESSAQPTQSQSHSQAAAVEPTTTATTERDINESARGANVFVTKKQHSKINGLRR
nr:uncharacterized protein CI109_006505 [Kwoniella shandongensis]KAA5525135.1 hypothetical protein CI109_006505 [Kwoniella shandongensis]